MDYHDTLTKLDQELMSEINNVDIKDVINQCQEMINEEFGQIDFKLRFYSNKEVVQILSLIDKIIPGIPQAEEIFTQLYNNEVVKQLVDKLLASTVAQFTTLDIDALTNPKLNHPFAELNDLPYYMKKFIVNKSYDDLILTRCRIAYNVKHMLYDRDHL